MKATRSIARRGDAGGEASPAGRLAIVESSDRFLRRDLRTLPERIADVVGNAIVNGEYGPGEHIPEQKLAAMFEVSHGPVREALRMLERRGLVEVLPRRGAYAIEVTLDSVADTFNIRAVLFALAARSLAMRPDPKLVTAPAMAAVHALQEMAARRDTDPLEFAQATRRVGLAVVENCGSPSLARILKEQARGTLWGILWHERSLDFLSQERRRTAANDWQAAIKAAAAGNGTKAEQIIRHAFFDSRDAALAALRKIRRQKVDEAKLIHD